MTSRNLNLGTLEQTITRYPHEIQPDMADDLASELRDCAWGYPLPDRHLGDLLPWTARPNSTGILSPTGPASRETTANTAFQSHALSVPDQDRITVSSCKTWYSYWLLSTGATGW